MCSVPRGIPRYISFPLSLVPAFMSRSLTVPASVYILSGMLSRVPVSLRPVRGTLVPRFLPSVFLHESLPCRFPCRRVLPFPRTFLHDLFPPVHPEVVPIFS